MSPHSYVRTSKSGKLNSKTEPDLATDYRNLAGGGRELGANMSRSKSTL